MKLSENYSKINTIYVPSFQVLGILDKKFSVYLLIFLKLKIRLIRPIWFKCL